VVKELGDYKFHWERFKNEFNTKLKDLGIKFKEYPDKVFEKIYNLLYKYTWCIPASTFDTTNKNNRYPDISLFDHSRVLSAVAVILYDYGKEYDKEESILHVKADISGIQNFIYTVYKKPVAKTLRGRSLFVALLPEVFSRYIINNLNYPVTNILYSGGGVFELIVANTEDNRKKLEKIMSEYGFKEATKKINYTIKYRNLKDFYFNFIAIGILKIFSSLISDRLKIDYIFYKNLKLINCQRIDIDYSDHYPIIAKFKL
jgi:CRISPR-associated protein Csm1